MPRKKITLEEAFAVFEREGLKVKVAAIEPQLEQVKLADFMEPVEEVKPQAEAVSKKFIKITLYAPHSIGSGGEMVVNADGSKSVINNGVQTYGPGIVIVPASIAQHLLHQDMRAQRADNRTYDRKLRSFAVFRQSTNYGVINAARIVSMEDSFNIAAYVSTMGEGNMFHL